MADITSIEDRWQQEDWTDDQGIVVVQLDGQEVRPGDLVIDLDQVLQDLFLGGSNGT